MPALPVPEILALLRSKGDRRAPGGTFHCFYKPNRRVPRRFNARSVARAACAAIRAGVTPQEIRLEMRECVSCTENPRDTELLQQAMAAIAANQQVIIFMISVIAAVASLASGVLLISRFVPQARLAAVAIAPVVNRLNVFLGTVIARRAANDALLVILRRAA